jgi:hypothetical protein
MRVARLVLSFLLIPSASPRVNSQQSTSAQQRDPQAIALLQSSVRAMGGNVPLDSVANGTVLQTAGSLSTTGNIRILTRGTEQTSDDIQWPNCTDSNVYSSQRSVRVACGNSSALSMEEAATNQGAYSPMMLIAHFLNESDSAIQLVRLEVVSGKNTAHLRLSETYSSSAVLQRVAPFSVRDLWLDTSTALPVQLQYVQSTGQGSADQHRTFLLQYSTYQSANGYGYPSTIQVRLNGVPWRTIAVTSLSLNTGLTDGDFPVDGGQAQ